MEKHVVVVGGGLMGCGIAAAAASAGERVVVVELVEALRESGPDRVFALDQELFENGLITEEALEKAKGAVTFSGDLQKAVQGAFFIIEAIIENLEAKQALFKQLDEMVPASVPIVSNTSGLRITEIAEYVTHKERVATAHFWLPAHIVPLVEIVMSDNGTSMETAERVKEILLGWGKAPVIVKKDLPGQLANRVLHAMIREATNVVEMGLASVEDVDTAIKMGLGIRLPVWGILEHCDRTGLDFIQKVQNSVLPDLSVEQKASACLDRLCEEGDLGYKSGKGFYDWNVRSMEDLEALRNTFVMRSVKMIREHKAGKEA